MTDQLQVGLQVGRSTNTLLTCLSNWLLCVKVWIIGSAVDLYSIWHGFSLTIYLYVSYSSFATQARNALLFYNGRFNDLHDFMALEIINAQVQFSFSTGDQVVKVSPYVQGGVNDGKWHKVTVDYLNMVRSWLK